VFIDESLLAGLWTDPADHWRAGLGKSRFVHDASVLAMSRGTHFIQCNAFEGDEALPWAL
jgi:hypothetical protein